MTFFWNKTFDLSRGQVWFIGEEISSVLVFTRGRSAIEYSTLFFRLV
jgi:hypothetical protein